jgi:DNA-binding PadR family transcriptional regulator
MELLGSFEQAVLLAVVRLRAEAYGRAVLQDVRRRLGAGVTSGAVYITLQRMEGKKLLASRRNGARRYFFVLTEGLRALEKTKAAVDKVWEGFG